MSQTQFSLPPAIDRFIAGVNGFDIEALTAPFTEDALVNDIRREFWGKAAIRAFADREFIGDKVTMAVTEARAHYGMVVLAARIDGTYDKTNLPDPLILTFYFTMAGDRIAALIIIHNQPVAPGA